MLVSIGSVAPIVVDSTNVVLTSPGNSHTADRSIHQTIRSFCNRDYTVDEVRGLVHGPCTRGAPGHRRARSSRMEDDVSRGRSFSNNGQCCSSSDSTSPLGKPRLFFRLLRSASRVHKDGRGKGGRGKHNTNEQEIKYVMP